MHGRNASLTSELLLLLRFSKVFFKGDTKASTSKCWFRDTKQTSSSVSSSSFKALITALGPFRRNIPAYRAAPFPRKCSV